MADQEMVLDGSESTFVWRKSYLRKNWWLVKDGNIIASIKIGNIVKVKATGFYNDIHFNVVQQSRSYYRIEFMREGVTIREGAFLFDQGNPITIRLEIKNGPDYLVSKELIKGFVRTKQDFKMTGDKSNLISETEFHQTNIQGRSKFTLKAQTDSTLDLLFLAMMNLIGAYLITLMISGV